MGANEGAKMVKLDVSKLRYMSREHFRVLTAIEIGMKNHEIVPVTLIDRIAGLNKGGARRFIAHLLRDKLIAHDCKKYDGYFLTYRGYDHLALKAFVNRGLVAGMGRQIGCGFLRSNCTVWAEHPFVQSLISATSRRAERNLPTG